MMLRLLICLVALCQGGIPGMGADGSAGNVLPGSPPNFRITPLPSEHLPHVFRVSTGVYSGATPANERAFAFLAGMGIKAIISVDGARPDVSTAHRHGLRYIHLPLGYDGIPSHRVAALIRAAESAGGPVYVHCHHGRHRGPAAAAVICEGTAGWTTNQAIAWLGIAGTAPEYAGLYRSTITFRPPTPGELASVGELPEVTATSSRIETMVAIDDIFGRLKSAQQRDEKGIPGDPGASPISLATVLWEHFRELERREGTALQTNEYALKLARTVKLADQLRRQLQEPTGGGTRHATQLQSLGQACVDCHRRFRN